MADLLTIDLHPPSPWWRRILIGSIALLAIAAFAWTGAANDRPRVLGVGGEDDYARDVERRFAGARTRIWIMLFVVRSEYDGPVRAMMQALADARGRGVDVVVMLDRPRADDERDAERNQAAARWLSEHDVRVVWDEPERTSHAKVLLIDDVAVVGSHNWTRSALVANRELSVLEHDPAVIAMLERRFHEVPGFDVKR
jgi:phosphatidylserine/phosphatidylglycerophosphate/cardiolipin synthase-like enzyme